MPRALPQRRRAELPRAERSAATFNNDEPLLNWRLLTDSAWIVTLVVVIARATLQEILRDPLDINPGATPTPRGAGPAAAVVFNLLACLPSILVLLRHAFDRSFTLRRSWSCRLAVLLGAWILLSAFWAGDRFTALVGGSTFVAALALVWSTAQLVRDWRRLGVVTAVCFGLLAVFSAFGLNQHFVEQPDLRRSWQENGAQLLSERGLQPGTFAAKQFEQRALAGELLGFTASPNSFAAVLVMLMIVSAGALIEFVRNGRGFDRAGERAATVRERSPGPSDQPLPHGRGSFLSAIVILLAIGLAAWVLTWTDSRTAYATPFLAAAALGGVALLRPWLASRSRLAYALGVAAVLLGMAAVVGHGLYHKTLFHISLTFRWIYWTGAARLFAHHPFIGVGWGDFGSHYLAFREAFPPEEIKDPHNFIVRFFVELGLVGGIVMVAWMLRLWWELTRPRTPDADSSATSRRWTPTIIAIAAFALLLNVLASVDFSVIKDYVAIEVAKRILAAGLFAGAAWFIAKSLSPRIFPLPLGEGRGEGELREPSPSTLALTPTLSRRERGNSDADEQPWLLYTILIALGIFLLHNLIDFSLFETGPLFLFSLLVGAALGLRGGPVAGRSGAKIVLAVASLGWLVAAGALAVPVISAERSAQDADEALRRGELALAANLYGEAFDRVPYNADYAYRQGRALILAQAPDDLARQAFDRAAAADRFNTAYPLARARLALRQTPVDADAVLADFERVLALNPREVDVRLEFAAALEALHRPDVARRHYESALEYDRAMPAHEPRRLAADKVAEIQRKIVSLPASQK